MAGINPHVTESGHNCSLRLTLAAKSASQYAVILTRYQHTPLSSRNDFLTELLKLDRCIQTKPQTSLL